MIDGICRANNKHPSEGEGYREYVGPDEKIRGYNGDLCARLKPGFLKLDIDDFDHDIEQIQSTIQGINDFVLETGLRCGEVDTILREETLEKLRNIINQKEEKNLSPVAVANELLEQHHLIYLNSNLYAYQNGVYVPFGKDQINSYISKHYPFAKIRFRQEVTEQVKGAAYIDQIEETALVNVKNGLLEIMDDGTVKLHPHSLDVISFRQFNANYDPSAVCPVLDKALENAFSGSLEQIELFNQIMGYLLMNHTRYQKCFFWVGLPSSAKSTFSTMVRRFCGEDNVSSIELEDLGKRFGAAGIVNKTLNIVPDIKKTKLFASGLFKALVGGDAVRIEQKYREAFDYVFTGKMIFGMNLFPDFSADFEGIERRLVILKFERVYKPTDPDYNPNIDDDLSTDEAMSALLNRAISGYKSLIQNKGFLETQKSKQQMAAFVSENDSVVAWVESLDDASILEREPISGPEGLYKAYETRCNSAGEKAKDQKDFTRIIKTRYGYETARKRIDGKQYPMFIKN